MAAVAAIIYNQVYIFALGTNFSKLVNNGSLLGSNLAVCLLATGGYWLLYKKWRRKSEIVFNITVCILSFASIIIPISTSLPLDITAPELFPGLAIPMHFFPAMALFTLKPIFIKESITSSNNH